MEIAEQAQQTSFNDLLSIIAVIGAMIVGLYLLTWRWSKLVLKTNTETIKTSVDALNTRINDTNENLTLLRTELHQGLTQVTNSLTVFMSARGSHQGTEPPHMDASHKGRLP